MNPNINLHIESIVLDGVDLAPGQSQLLQQTVASQLTTMLTERIGSHSSDATSDWSSQRANVPLPLGTTLNATSLGLHLATAIYANIPQSHFGTRTAHGGRS
jgi:hypothetical protein